MTAAATGDLEKLAALIGQEREALLERWREQVRAHTPRGEVVVGAWQGGARGRFECWVRDNGAGIPPERLATVFDKSESDPGNTEGWGLGLAIVKTFIEAHDGTVSVESTEGQGSTFHFTLPPGPPAAASRAP